VGLIRRLPLDAGIEVLLPATVVLFTLGSTSVQSLASLGHSGRWAALVVLALLAVAAAASRKPSLRAVPPAWAAAALLLALGIVSASWSVDARLTLERGATLVVLFTTSAALALRDERPSVAAARTMRAVLLGIGLVAVGSLIVVAVARRDAVLAATAGAGWRFRGLGQNPNTVPMLLAVGLPLSVWQACSGRGWARRAGLALVLLFAGEIAVSGSRGALVSGFAGALVTAVVLARGRRARVVLVVVLVALAAVCAVTPKLQGHGVALTSSGPSAPARPQRGKAINAESVFRLQDELGHPPLGAYRPPVPRTFLGSSGRAQAWVGALHQGAQRPSLGYGYGTEDKVFVDRYYAFEGGYVENTYIGLFLQLGVVGVAVFLALLALLAWSGAKILRRGLPAAVGPGAAALGVLAASVLVGMTQTGVLTVGNLAATSMWFAMLVLPRLAQEPVA